MFSTFVASVSMQVSYSAKFLSLFWELVYPSTNLDSKNFFMCSSFATLYIHITFFLASYYKFSVCVSFSFKLFRGQLHLSYVFFDFQCSLSLKFFPFQSSPFWIISLLVLVVVVTPSFNKQCLIVFRNWSFRHLRRAFWLVSRFSNSTMLDCLLILESMSRMGCTPLCHGWDIFTFVPPW